MATAIPHFSLPFRIVGGAFVVVEQDSSAEIADCIAVACLTLKGERIEEPTYGITDPTFTRGEVAAGLLKEIQPWEPRANLHISEPVIATAIELTIASTPGG